MNLSEFDEWENMRTRLHIFEHFQHDNSTCFALATETLQRALDRNVRWQLEDWTCYDSIIRTTSQEQKHDALVLIENVRKHLTKASAPTKAIDSLIEKFEEAHKPEQDDAADSLSKLRLSSDQGDAVLNIGECPIFEYYAIDVATG